MAATRKRCAVYTRKSTEDGLEQDFNSLDAQSESCRAYILSQAGEGWSALDKAYDDGGISGGHMDRPSLQSLISDIEAGLIDIVVVYKVDRLTRSLADFAKLVDVFDRHAVSFVSVTQAFNTTSSMGRLTLNVLLSFAQFEREVTAERIRDKIAASKRRGQWMGGLPPLGYDNADKRLIINEDEAKTVQHIMTRYVALGSVGSLKTELDQNGYRTKVRRTKKECQVGGRPFSRGHLYKLLSNPIYIGKITHKSETYEGQHEAIIDPDLWKQVQSTLETNAPNRRHGINTASPHLLTGLLYHGQGERLTPVHTRKPKGKRYRYYISSRLAKGEEDDGTALRLPAETIERAVVETLSEGLTDTPRLLDGLGLSQLDPINIQRLKENANALASILRTGSLKSKRDIILNLLRNVSVTPTCLEIDLRSQPLLNGIDTAPIEGSKSMSLSQPMRLKRRGVETRLILGGVALPEPSEALIRLLAVARDGYDGLKSGRYASQKDIGLRYGLDKSDVSRVINLAFLSPRIVTAIIGGAQPTDLTVQSLKKMAAKLPSEWGEQETMLGISC